MILVLSVIVALASHRPEEAIHSPDRTVAHKLVLVERATEPDFCAEHPIRAERWIHSSGVAPIKGTLPVALSDQGGR